MEHAHWRSCQTEDGSFFIQYAQFPGYTRMKSPHFHDSYEIFYLLEGEIDYFIKDKIHTVQKGDLVVIHPYELHRTAGRKADSGYERYVLTFTDPFVAPLLDSAQTPLLPPARPSGVLRTGVKDNAKIERLLGEMMKECRQRGSHYRAVVQSLLLQLLVLIDRYSTNYRPAEVRPYAHPMEEKISEITAYITEHFHEEVTLEKIAALFYISPSYLSRIFKKITGFHLREYIQFIRIREAQRLLRETDDKVTEIAGKVGFVNITHFNRTFKSMTHVCPRKYRKLYV